MLAYKPFNRNLQADGAQFKVRRTYGRPNSGQYSLHCHYTLDDCFLYHPPDSRICIVRVHGSYLQKNRRLTAQCLEIVSEMTPQMILIMSQTVKKTRDGEWSIRWSDGTIAYYKGCVLHRQAGPAIKWADGTKEWFLYGFRHRRQGPAVELPIGFNGWFKHGKLVRFG